MNRHYYAEQSPRGFADDLRELMARWDEYRAKWIETYGTEEGFSEWFTQQVTTKS
jgi:hypothetical protein